MKDLKFTPGPLTVWGKNKSTVVEGFYMIEQSLSPRVPTAYVASYNDALLYAKAPEMYEALKQAKGALSRVSNCNDLATAREYSREALETINKLGL